MSKAKRKPTVVSMFSGCGGMDLGFVRAGYDVVWANDFDADACEPYRHNIGDIIHGDVTKLDVPAINIDAPPYLMCVFLS